MIWHLVLIGHRQFDGRVPRSSVALRVPNRARRLHLAWLWQHLFDRRSWSFILQRFPQRFHRFI